MNNFKLLGIYILLSCMAISTIISNPKKLKSEIRVDFSSKSVTKSDTPVNNISIYKFIKDSENYKQLTEAQKEYGEKISTINQNYNHPANTLLQEVNQSVVDFCEMMKTSLNSHNINAFNLITLENQILTPEDVNILNMQNNADFTLHYEELPMTANNRQFGAKHKITKNISYYVVLQNNQTNKIIWQSIVQAEIKEEWRGGYHMSNAIESDEAVVLAKEIVTEIVTDLNLK